MFPFQAIKHYSKQRFKGPTLMSDVVINNIHLDIHILRQLFITCFLRETTCARGHWVYTISVLSNPFLHSGQGDRDCVRVIPSTMSHPVGYRAAEAPGLTPGHPPGEVRKYNELFPLA